MRLRRTIACLRWRQEVFPSMDRRPACTPLPAWSQREQMAQRANRQRRVERWEQVQKLLKKGASNVEIGRQLNLDHRTVRKFRDAEVYPEAKPRARQFIVDDYAAYLDRRLDEGCLSTADALARVTELGFRGQVNSVRYWLRQRRNSQPRPPGTPPPRPVLRASPRQVVWFMLKATPAAKGFLEEVYRASPEIERIARLAQDSFSMVRERQVPALIPWTAAANAPH